MLDPEDFPSAIAFAFEAVGGIGAAAKVCCRSYQALNKWRLAAGLPRTDYTGETKYAFLLADAALQNGNAFDASWLLEASASRKQQLELEKRRPGGRPVPPTRATTAESGRDEG